MAPVTVVSDATASTSSAGYNAKPIYYNGRAYVFLRNGTTNFSVYSATFDDTSGFGTFTEEDSANRPGSGSTTITSIESYDVAQDPDTPTDVYVLVYGTVSGGNYQMEWSRFDMSNTTNDAQGSWETIENAVLASTFVKLAGSDRGTISVRTDGDIVVLYNGPSDKNHGTDYARVYYTRYNGSTWSTPALVEGTTGDTVTYNFPVQVMGKSDLAHFFWYNGTNWKTASFTSGDTLNTLQNIGTSFDNTTAKSHPIYYLSGTDELIYFVHKASDGHPQYNLMTNDGTPGSDTEMDDVAIFNQGSPWQETMQLGIDPTDGSLWLGYADSATQDVWRVDDSGWLSATEVADGQTIEDMSINVVQTDESAVCMLFCWQDDVDSAMEVEYYVISAGGTTTPQSAAGSITPTGAISRQAGKQAAGSIAPSGALVRSVSKAVAGSLGSSGAPTKKTLKAFAGAITPTGTLATIKLVFQAVAGALAPSGALVIKTLKQTAGTITPSGALSTAAQYVRTLTGAITPSGTVAAAGRYARALAGSITPTSTLATVKAVQQAVAGALAPAGALTIKTLKAVSGAITPSGANVYKTLKQVAGSITPSGALNAVKSGVTQQAVAGVLAPAGALVIKTLKQVAGVITPAGDVNKATSISTAGALTPSGALIRKAQKALAGALASSGTLATLQLKAQAVAGAIAPAGALTVKVMKALAGAITPTGAISKQISKTFSGVMALAGALTTAQNQVNAAGVLGLSGALSTVYLGSVIGDVKGNPGYQNDLITRTRHGGVISFDEQSGRYVTFRRVKRG